MTLIDYILLIVVGLAIGAALYFSWRRKKRGGGCCGGCGSCDCGCSGKKKK